MPKKMKMRTEDGKWIIDDNGRIVIFDNAYDAWQYVFLMRELRPVVPCVAHSMYPVRSLNPLPISKNKTVSWG